MIGSRLFSLLSGTSAITSLVGTRIYPQVIPQGSAMPAVAYSVVDEVPENSLTGWSSGLSNARVQVDAYAPTYVSAQALADAIAGALATYQTSGLSVLLESKRDGYEDETSLHRVSLDFSMWVS